MTKQNAIENLKTWKERNLKAMERRQLFSKYFKNARDEGQFDRACHALEMGMGYTEEERALIKDLIKFDDEQRFEVVRSFFSHEEIDELIAGLECTQDQCNLSQHEIKIISSLSEKLEKVYE
jgi:hypothetical protein